jgi:PAS domain S-box-containing protein
MKKSEPSKTGSSTRSHPPEVRFGGRDLRRQAEEKINKQKTKSTPAAGTDATRLVHELQVHQIELEMQNEELLRAQEELEASRSRYFELYDLAPVGYITVSEKGLVLEANLLAAKLLGVIRASLVKRPFSQFILKEDQDIYYLHRKRLLESGDPQAFELRMVHKDGSLFWVHLSANLAADPGASAGVIQFVLKDISERKQAEQELIHEEQWLEAIFETVPDGITYVDRSGRITYANRAAEKLLGLERSILLGRTYNDALWKISAVDGGGFPDEQLPFMRVMQTNAPVAGIQHAIEYPDGRRVVLSINASPRHTADGELIGMVAAITDVTERTRAGEALRKSHQDLSLLSAINAAVNNGESLPAIIKLISFGLQELFKSFGATIHLVNADRSRLVMQNLTLPGTLVQGVEKVIGMSIPRVEHDLSLAHPYRRVMETAQPELINTLAGVVEFTGAFLLATPWAERTRARVRRMIPTIIKLIGRQYVMVVPLVSDQQVIGTLDVGSREPFTEEDLQRLEAIAGQLTTAIQRKQADEEQHGSEQTLVSIYNTVGDVLFYLAVEPEGQYRFQTVNPAFLAVTGLSEEQVVGRRVGDVIPEPALGIVLERYRQAITEKSLVRWEETSNYPNGRVTGEVCVAPVFDLQGQCTHLVGSVHDLTRRIRLEEEKREASEVFRLAFRYNPAGMSITSTEGRFLKVNPALCEMLGYPEKELLTRSFRELTLPADMDISNDLFRQLVEGEREFAEVEKRYLHKDGSEVWIFLCSSAVRNLEGKPLYFVSQMVNISERKRMEQKLQEYNAQLEQAVNTCTRDLHEAQDKLLRQERLAVMGQLAGSVGHELRNPLGVISNAVYFLKLTQPEASGKVKEYLDLIESEIRISDKIVTDLLDFSRVKSADRQVVEVSKLVGQTLERFPAPGNVTVKLDLPAGLPPVFADPQQMMQVLANLTINACQAMPDGGVLTVSGEPSPVGGWVLVRVKDTGIGIPPENLQKLFEPLFTTKMKGIGLGLAVSKRLAEANGGRLEVESQPGVGSTFTLILPQEEAQP